MNVESKTTCRGLFGNSGSCISSKKYFDFLYSFLYDNKQNWSIKLRIEDVMSSRNKKRFILIQSDR